MDILGMKNLDFNNSETRIEVKDINTFTETDQIKIIGYEIGANHMKRILSDYDKDYLRNLIKEASARSINTHLKGRVSKVDGHVIMPTYVSDQIELYDLKNPVIGGFFTFKQMLNDIVNGRTITKVDEEGNVIEVFKFNKKQADRYLTTLFSPIGLWTIIVVSVRAYAEQVIKNGDNLEGARYLQVRLEAKNKCQNKIKNICIDCARGKYSVSDQALLIKNTIEDYESKIIQNLPREIFEEITKEGVLHRQTDRKSILKKTIQMAEPIIEDITKMLTLVKTSDMIDENFYNSILDEN